MYYVKTMIQNFVFSQIQKKFVPVDNICNTSEGPRAPLLETKILIWWFQNDLKS